MEENLNETSSEEYPSHPLEIGCRPALKVRMIEVLVFLFLIVPSMALSFLVVRHGHLKFNFMAAATILRDLAMMFLVLFFLWRNREPFEDIGWRRRNLPREIGWGLILFVPFFLGTTLLENLLHMAGFSLPAKPPGFFQIRGAGQVVLATVLVIVVAWTEETIFRGYLILRFRNIASGAAVPILLSSGVFALGHGYEGSAGLITVGVMGAIFALIYLWRKSLIAPVVMHFLQDFLGIVLVPMFKPG